MAGSSIYNNLIDVCIELEDDPELKDKPGEILRKLLVEYFFKEEVEQSKNLELLVSELEIPGSISGAGRIFDIDFQSLEDFVNGETVNSSLSGRIMLSKDYLKTYYRNHPPAFAKLPQEIKMELVDKIKAVNGNIITSFEKMQQDRETDKNRKVITLIALIMKNVYHRTGYPFQKLKKPANDIINSVFDNTDDVFMSEQRQVAELRDDAKINELIKNFFVIRQYKDIAEISEVYKYELERYRKRGLLASL